MNATAPNRTRFLILCGLNLGLLALGIWFTTRWEPARKEFPAKPVDLVVPFGAGGGSDAYARIFKKAIDDDNLLPETLVIHNRGGAGATIGSRFVRDATPDGYTMLLLHDAIITAKYSGMVRFGPEAFDPIACTGELGMVIAVAADSPYQTLNDLMNAAREKPGELSFAVNLGALTHVAGLQLEQAVPGAKFLFPQSGGGNDRYIDLIGKHVDVTGFSLEEYLQFREGGDDQANQLRGLAYLDLKRNNAVPEVPTASEQGYDVVIINRFYWWVPKGTPPDRIQVLANGLKVALETKLVKDRMAQTGCVRIFRTGEELTDQLAATEGQIAQVEFTKPQGVPDMQRIIMIAVALFLCGWAFQSRQRRVQIAATASLLICLLVGHFAEGIDGWSLFVGLAGLGLLANFLRPLLTEPMASLATAWTLAYVISLTAGWGDFRLLTILFVLLIGGTLTRWNHGKLPALGLIAQSLAFGIYAVFTFLFEVPLPS